MADDNTLDHVPESSDEAAAATPSDCRPTMEMKVYAAFKIYYEGPAYSITGVNQTGPFDVLPHHHNFISVLSPCKLLLKTPTGERSIKISRAVMHVKAEKVTVFVDV